MPKPKRHLNATRPLSDKEYINIMERVANENWRKWSDPSATAAFDRILNSNDYDYRGFYNANPRSRANADTHWPDTYKTVYHPTFSRDSKYSNKVSKFNPNGLRGGTWYGDTFVPALWQSKNTINKYMDILGIPASDNYKYKAGGTIHINPANRGKFTATMKRTGKTAEELSHSSNPLTRKRAIFALNARKWNH